MPQAVFIDVTVFWEEDDTTDLKVVYAGPAADLEECGSLCRGSEFVPNLFYGPLFTGNDLSLLTSPMLLEYLETMKDYSKQESVKIDDVFNAVTFDGDRLPRDAPVDEFKKESGLYSKFMVSYGRVCRVKKIFGDATALQRERAKDYDRVLARNSAMWDVLITLRTLEDCQKDDYNPAEANGLGFQTAMYPAEGTKEGNAEMYERLLTYTFTNNLRRSGSTVYQEQKADLQIWKAREKHCSARDRLLHAPFSCRGEYVYGICVKDGWCLAYAEVVCEISVAEGSEILGEGKAVKALIDEEFGKRPKRIVSCTSEIEAASRRKAATIWQSLWGLFECAVQSHISENVAPVDPTAQVCGIVAKSVRPVHYEEYIAALGDRDAARNFCFPVRFSACKEKYFSALESYVGSVGSRVRAEGKRGKTAVVDLRKVLNFSISEVVIIGNSVRELQRLAKRAVDTADMCEELKSVYDDSGYRNIGALVFSDEVSTNNARLFDRLREECDALRSSPMWRYIEESWTVFDSITPAASSDQRVKFFDRAKEVAGVFEDLCIQMRKYACSWWLRIDDDKMPPGESNPAKAVCSVEKAFGWQLSVATLCAREFRDASNVRNRVCVTIFDAHDDSTKYASCLTPVWKTSKREGILRGELVRIESGSRTWIQTMKRQNDSCMQAMTIDDLVMSVIDTQRVESTARWRGFVERFSANLHNAAEYMTKTVDPGFQEHHPDPRLFSFTNGMYNIKTNEFCRYGAVPSDWNSGINYINQYFDPLLVSMPIECIRVPGYDDILESQQYNVADTGGSKQYWMDVFIGRLFFKVDEKDHWQKVLIIKGQGATGKSSIAKAIIKCIGERNVGIVASNCEPQYALANMQSKTMWMCTEMKAGFRLDMAAMQNMISGDPVTIHAKHKDAVDVAAWRLPGLLIGNEIPQAWTCDVGGALLRRTVLFEFAMNPKKQDDTISKKLEDNLPAFLVRTTRTYLQETAKNNGALSLPPGMQGFQNTFAKITSPFAQFLTNTSGKYDFSDEDRLYSIYHQLFNAGEAGHIEIDVESALTAVGVLEGVSAGSSSGGGGGGSGSSEDCISAAKERISIGTCYSMKAAPDGSSMLVEDCGLSRETLRRVCAWRKKQGPGSDAIKPISPAEPDGGVALSVIMKDYKEWKESKKTARSIPELDKGTVEAMCKELGILYRDDKLYGLLNRNEASDVC